jgi:hypothetical protein
MTEHESLDNEGIHTEQTQSSEEPNMDSTQKTNPAWRLYNFIVTSQVNTKKTNGSKREWLVAQNVDPPNQNETQQLAMDVIEVVGQVRRAITRLPTSPINEMLIQYLPSIQSWIARIAFTPERGIAGDIGEEVLYSLRMAALVLDSAGESDPDQPTGTGRILDLINDLLREIREDQSLSPIARAFLLDKVLDIQRAILRVDLLGIAFVEAKIDELIGGAIVYPEARKQSLLSRLAALWHGIHATSAGVAEIAATSSSVIALVNAITDGSKPGH